MGKLAITLSAVALAVGPAVDAPANAATSTRGRVPVSEKKRAIAIVDTPYIRTRTQHKDRTSPSVLPPAASAARAPAQRARTAQTAPTPALSAAQQHYLSLAQAGVASAKRR
jgi:hypothetical protein